jgi:cell division protein FtsW
MSSVKTNQQTECPVDMVTFGCVLFLVLLGFIMVTSASSEISARNFGNPFYLSIKHLAYMAVAAGTAALVLLVPLWVWQRSGWLLMLFSFILLVSVLIPGIGVEVNGSTRWIPLGFFTL